MIVNWFANFPTIMPAYLSCRLKHENKVSNHKSTFPTKQQKTQNNVGEQQNPMQQLCWVHRTQVSQSNQKLYFSIWDAELMLHWEARRGRIGKSDPCECPQKEKDWSRFSEGPAGHQLADPAKVRICQLVVPSKAPPGLPHWNVTG